MFIPPVPIAFLTVTFHHSLAGTISSVTYHPTLYRTGDEQSKTPEQGGELSLLHSPQL